MGLCGKILWGDFMKLIVCLDEKNGMLFNKRRQSRDRLLIENVLELCKGETLYTSQYSARLFPENSVEITDFPDRGYVFCENFTVDEAGLEQIIVYKWNRVYPADTYFNIDLEDWQMLEIVDFKGSSHEKITREIYVR